MPSLPTYKIPNHLNPQPITQNQPKAMTDQTAKPTPLELKRLELIRQLEGQSYIFATSPKTATATAKTTDGTPFTKLLKRAKLIDSDNTLKSALQKSEFFLNLAGRMYGMAGFALGFLGGVWLT